MDIAQRFARVLASALWAWVAVWLVKILGLEFTGDDAANLQSAMVVFFAAVINAAIAWGSKQFPWLEYLLLVPTKPRFLTLVERNDIGHAVNSPVVLSSAAALPILTKLEV